MKATRVEWWIFRMPICGGPAQPSPNGPYAVRDNAQKMAEDLTAEFPEEVYWIQPEVNDCTLSAIIGAIEERAIVASNITASLAR